MGRESKIRKLRRLKIIPEVKQRGEKRPLSKGWKITIWSIVAIALVLIVMGIWAYNGRDVAARVGSQVITTNEVESRAFDSLAAQLPSDQLDYQSAEFQQQLEGERDTTLQRLIQEKIYIEAAKKENVAVTEDDYNMVAQDKLDSEVKLQVVQKPEEDWTEEDKKTWEDWMTDAGYENEVQLRDFIRSRFAGEIEFKTHRQKAIGDTLDGMEATDEEAREWYNQKGAMRLSHILLSYDVINDEPEKAKTQREKLSEIHDRIVNGEISFADAANESTEDQKGSGGDLGWYNIQNGKLINEAGTAGLVEEFEKMALTLEPGEVSDIVQTQFGFHIIKCTEVRNNSVNYDLQEGVRVGIIRLTVGNVTDENAAPATEEEWNKVKAEADDIIKQIKSGKLSFADAASRYSIDQFTKDNGGEIPSMMASDASGYFWANLEDAVKYEGQGMYPFESTVISKAYDLTNGQVSEPVRTSDSWVIVKKIDYRPATKLSFEDVKDQVKNDILILKKNEFESNWLSEKRGQIDVSIGNPWTKFANWWENSVVAPIEDFGRWVSGLLGKNLSEQSSTSTEVPLDMPEMTQEELQQILQQQGGEATAP